MLSLYLTNSSSLFFAYPLLHLVAQMVNVLLMCSCKLMIIKRYQHVAVLSKEKPLRRRACWKAVKWFLRYFKFKLRLTHWIKSSEKINIETLLKMKYVSIKIINTLELNHVNINVSFLYISLIINLANVRNYFYNQIPYFNHHHT